MDDTADGPVARGAQVGEVPRWRVWERPNDPAEAKEARRLAFPVGKNPGAPWKLVSGVLESVSRAGALRQYERALPPPPHPFNEPAAAGEVAALLDDLHHAVSAGLREFRRLWPKEAIPPNGHVRRQRMHLLRTLMKAERQLDVAADEWDTAYQRGTPADAST